MSSVYKVACAVETIAAVVGALSAAVLAAAAVVALITRRWDPEGGDDESSPGPEHPEVDSARAEPEPA